MDLSELARHWDAFGAQDPLWAVLSDPAKKGGRWDPEELFAVGEADVASLLHLLRAVGLDPDMHGRALDFGCGVGRLTQALAPHFDEVVGVDVAATMIEHAERYNRQGGRCRFIVNRSGDLSFLPDDSFSFLVSILVLQHIPPNLSHQYLREFVRVLAPGGLGVFQVPSTPPALVARSAMPPLARHADLTVHLPLPLVTAGSRFPVTVTVHNTTPETWPVNVENPVNLGNHWLTEDHTVVAWDDGRSAVALPLRAGVEADIVLTCTAPSEPGRYLLTVDVVQECVAWFDCNVRPVGGALVTVASRPSDEEVGEPDVFVPTMEMHGLPIRDVVEELEGSGAVVTAVLPDGPSNGFWRRSHLYVFTKLP